MNLLYRVVAVSIAVVVSGAPAHPQSVVAGGPPATPPALSASMKAKVTALVICEVQFTMTTTPAPVGPATDLALWLITTRRRLEQLADMAAALELPYPARHAVGELRSFLDYYESFRSDLELIDFVVKARLTEGDTTIWSTLASVADAVGGLLLSQSPATVVNPVSLKVLAAQVGAGVICKGGGYLMRRWDADGIASSLASKLDKLKEQEVVGRVSSFCSRFQELDRRIKDLASQAEFGVPSADDAFAVLQSAYELSGVREAGAADRLCEAVAALPESASLGYAYYDEHYRAPSMFLAAVLYERESCVDPDGAAVWWRRCCDSFEAGMETCGGVRQAASYEATLAYCRALAGLGDRARSAIWLERLQEFVARGPSDQVKALRTYDCAAVACRVGAAPERVLGLLQASYRQWPRRDPRALADPSFAGLPAAGRAQLEDIADNELLGGVWSYVSADRAVAYYAFYPGGALLQTFDNKRFTGSWQVSDGTLLLTDRREEKTRGTHPLLGDNTMPYVLSGSDRLTLRSGAQELVYSRSRGRRFSERNIAGIVLSDDGSWRWAGGVAPLRARCVASMDFERGAYTFTLLSERPVGGIDLFTRTEEQQK